MGINPGGENSEECSDSDKDQSRENSESDNPSADLLPLPTG